MTDDRQVGEIIREIVEKIKREYRPTKIILFGSHAYGSADRDSDIDLLIIKDTKERLIDRGVAVLRMVSDPERLVPFEPVVLTPEEVRERLEIGDQFIKEILQKGQVLYGG
jgi:predicted nucleotidyltransferase